MIRPALPATTPPKRHKKWLRYILLAPLKSVRYLLFILRKPLILFILGILTFICILYFVNKEIHLPTTQQKHIELTPEFITKIKETGQWEFLSINTEELVDTLRKGFLSDDRLARIYKGTLRLGINLSHTPPNWITTKNDTVYLQLPDIELLNPIFIDEARTYSFYESGHWKASARETMYQRAHKQMLQKNMTPYNVNEARENARVQFTNIFRALGFTQVIFQFQPRAESHSAHSFSNT